MVAVALVAVACGGDDGDSTLQTYADAIESIANGTSDAVGEINADFAASQFESREEGTEATRVLLRDLAGVFDTAAHEADEIDPPPETEAEHRSFVSASNTVAASFTALSGAIGRSDETDADAAANSALTDYATACNDLRTAIEQQGGEIDIDCVFAPQ